MQNFLDTILAITQEAEKLPKGMFRQNPAVSYKSDASPVTETDRKTERFIRDALQRHFPDHAIYGEEFGQTRSECRFQWVIDPIDGTRSFISGMPLYGMLIALLRYGKSVLGVVRMPELAEVYSGTEAGAFLNGNQRLRVSGMTSLADAFLYINEADKILASAPGVFRRLNRVGRDRRYCYDCYPHMLVAGGHVDACVDFDLKPYDYLSFAPIIEAAGGVVSDWQGNTLGLKSDGRVVSAATPQLHAEILQLLKED